MSSDGDAGAVCEARALDALAIHIEAAVGAQVLTFELALGTRALIS
jgi:hypothetical protein